MGSLRTVLEGLRRWFERVRVAVWLHPGEFDVGRRALLFGACALVAASVLAQVPTFGRRLRGLCRSLTPIVCLG